MAASAWSVECHTANPRVCTAREPAEAAHTTVVRDGSHASGKMRDILTAHEVAEMDRPAQPASVAEFAHDLCSPLNALAIAAHDLREGTLDHQSDKIDAIIRISEHTLGILRDALDHARIDAGRDVSGRETCDLEQLVDEVAEVNRPCARVKNLELLVRRDPAFPRHVHTDAPRLRRILINVLDNAVKYTTQGSIVLSLHCADDCNPERVWLVFEIRDTGIGIADKDQSRIFERFVRAPGAASTNGSGLGLTIASELVHKMGGTIEVESQPGTGSSFRIELPVARAQEADGSFTPSAPSKLLLPLEDLAALPYELRAELRESLLALDVSRVHKAIERIAEHNAPLGAILESHAKRLAFTGIFEAVSGGLGASMTARNHISSEAKIR